GLYMMAASLPLLALLFYRRWRGVLVCAAVMIAMMGVARVGVLSRLPMAPSDGGLHDLLTAHLAILVDQDVPMSNETYAFLNQVRDLDDRWAYDERRVAATTLPYLREVYHRAWAKQHAVAFRALYCELVSRNFLVAVRYFWDRSD